jgi:hypothetical protein
MVELCAICLVVATIVVVISWTDQPDARTLIPALGSPINVGLIASVKRQASCYLEEPSVANGVLIVVAVSILQIDLPFQTSIARCVIPPAGSGPEQSCHDIMVSVALRNGKCAFQC